MTGKTRTPEGSMAFFRTGGEVGCVDLLRNGPQRQVRRRLELAGLFARQGCTHEFDPYRQGGSCSGLFLAERFLFVVAHPDSAGKIWREAHKPCVCKIVG